MSIPVPQFIPYPLGIHTLVLYICVSISAPQIRASIPFSWASQVALMVKNPPANAGDIRDAGSIRGSGRSPGGGNGNLLQYSCLENPMDRGAWQATVHRVTKSRMQLQQLITYTYYFSRFHIYALIYGICFSLSDWLHCMTLFRSIHTSRSTSIHKANVNSQRRGNGHKQLIL